MVRRQFTSLKIPTTIEMGASYNPCFSSSEEGQNLSGQQDTAGKKGRHNRVKTKNMVLEAAYDGVILLGRIPLPNLPWKCLAEITDVQGRRKGAIW